MVSENNQPEQPQAAATPPAEQPAPPAAAAPAAPKSKKDMTPEERAAAIKAAQEKALRLKAERDAAKAAAAGTAVAVAAPAEAATAANGAVWRIPAAGGQSVAVARPDARQVTAVEQTDRQVQVTMKRRQVLRGGVMASLLGFIILSLGSFVNFFNPRHITGFGGIVKVPKSTIPEQGKDPVKIFDAKTWLVNLKPGEGGFQSIPGSKNGGLIALYQKCVHLGCTVPWRADFEFGGERGWFRCPCHGSTYTKGGARVFGPAPRSLDTFDLTINGDGSVSINTGKITRGDLDDPQRGKLPPA
ncbi:MAG TPA: ubiquinol-cytochrome c reductase iron-sulfur subunit [Dehalococcoidia bacterium]|nr:ubiquinol-cytochrome c reductase iron-sulfur subunit [Dehalococcoidia bacterium]